MHAVQQMLGANMTREEAIEKSRKIRIRAIRLALVGNMFGDGDALDKSEIDEYEHFYQ